MKKVYRLIHSISTKQTLYLVKYITFLVIVAVLLLENNSVILYSSLTYFIGIVFDCLSIKKQLGSNVNNKLYTMETFIMTICIFSIVVMVFLKFSGHTDIPYGREGLNIILILTTPHPLIEGLIKLQESEGK